MRFIAWTNGDQDLFFDLAQIGGLHERSRAVRPHAAGVGAFVAVVGRLVILRGWERDDRRAVGDREDAGLFADEHFFDDDLIAGVAELAIERNAVHGVERFAPFWHTKTPLPAARPSALITTGTSSRSRKYTVARLGSRKTW